MKTFTLTLTSIELEYLENLKNTRVYKNFSEDQIIMLVLCQGLYEESRLYTKLEEN